MPENPSEESAPSPAGADAPTAEHMRYLGTLGLLAECSVYAPEDIRESIEQAFADACAANPHLKYKRILNRLEIEVQFDHR